MAKDLKQHFDKIRDSVQSGLNSLQQMAQNQQISHFGPSSKETIKQGWLRKLSGSLKIWQRKWFVIKGDLMHYYFNNFDNKYPQGIVSLSGAEIIEHNNKINDSEKFVFEIIPKVVEGNGKLPGHNVLTLSAQTEEEKIEWIRVIRQILYGSVGGAIFGKPLEEILKFENARDNSRKVPEIVETCVDYILQNGINEEGIFRITGRSTVIKSFCDSYDRGERPSMEDYENMDVHSASSILKFYLRELPSPLVPFELYESAMRIVMRELPINEVDAMQSLKQMLGRISNPYYDLLNCLSRFLNTIGQHHLINKMTFSNLATIFCTAFLRPELEKDACLLMATANSRKVVTNVIIEHQSWLFGIDSVPFDGVVDIEGLMGISKSSFEQCFLRSENEQNLEDMRQKLVIMRSANMRNQTVKQTNRKCMEAPREGEDGDSYYLRWSSRNTFSSFNDEEEQFYSPVEFQQVVHPLKLTEELEGSKVKFTNENMTTELTTDTEKSIVEDDDNLQATCTSILPSSSPTNNYIEQLTECCESVDELSNDELMLVVSTLLSHIRKQNVIITDLTEKLKSIPKHLN